MLYGTKKRSTCADCRLEADYQRFMEAFKAGELCEAPVAAEEEGEVAQES